MYMTTFQVKRNDEIDVFLQALFNTLESMATPCSVKAKEAYFKFPPLFKVPV